MWFDEVKKFDWRYGEASQYKSPKLSTFNIEDKSERFVSNAIDFVNKLARIIVNNRLTPNRIKRLVLAQNYTFNQIIKVADSLQKRTNNRKLKQALDTIKEAIT